MLRKISSVIIGVMLFCSVSVSSLFADVEIMFLHTNDMHGQILPLKGEGKYKNIGGFKALKSLFLKERFKALKLGMKVIQIDSGDMFQGTPVGDMTKGEAIFKLMSKMHYDLGTIGNHDFDITYAGLRKRVKLLNYPLLCANIFERRNNKIPPFLKKYVIMEYKGIKLGFIGVITKDLPVLTLPSGIKELKIVPPEQVLPGIIKKLKWLGVKRIFLISHVGVERDREIAKNIKGIDIIFGGHSHTKLVHPEKVNNTLIIQSNCKTQDMTEIIIRLQEKTGKLLSYSSKLIDVKEKVFGRNQVMARDVDKVAGPILKPLMKKIGETTKRLVKISGPITNKNKIRDVLKKFHKYPFGINVINLGNDVYKIAETNLSDLVCEAFAEWAGVDIAFMNISGIRASYPEGELTLRDIYKMLPFDNGIWVLKMKGSDIYKIYDLSSRSRGSYLQERGLKVRYKIDKQNNKLILKSITYKGRKLDPNKEYMVCTNSFIAGGGDGYKMFKNAKIVKKIKGFMRDALASYIRKRKVISPVIDHRISFEK